VDADERVVRVVIETPRGSRNKYSFDADERVFTLSKVLPEGMSFPLDFGFVPKTKADDGDPIDVALLMDEEAFPGCVVAARIIGAIRGRQREDGRWVENDRLLAVVVESYTHADVDDVDDLNERFVEELERFFENYHQRQGHKFEVRGRVGAKAAMKLLKAARTG
jgi:inorganic pyrophosphatase